ncbi:MBL fold metallo-hydrolase [Candidatus Fermentibacteria bacterium]|nr:MBL fold metallo-hydrolase [Candidatus Fermentibacteria bacterium]
MLLERMESGGLAHYSYMVGSGTEAVVVDPRRDCEEYLSLARKRGVRITAVLETHRNEDYVIGSRELSARAGCPIWHADRQLDYGYGEPAEDGQSWKTGPLRIEAMLTPGHTPGSMSYLLYDPQSNPWICFTGDALFAGDVGRTDLLGMNRAREMAGMLYDSIYGKILSLGDGVILCPAHGSGSVCGSEISQRLWTTVGLERKHNPKLRHEDREAFVEDVAVELERPPYFTLMEKLNSQGPPVLGAPPEPVAMSASDFKEIAERATVLDTRTELAFSSAHLPGAQFIQTERVPAFAGWFVPHDRPIVLVTDDDPAEVVRLLFRMGYDDIPGFLAGGMLSWHTSGQDSASIPTMTVQDLCGRLDAGEELLILDVRSGAELEATGRIPGSQHVHLTTLPRRLDEIPRDSSLVIFCGSGLRSMIAASYLAGNGYHDIHVVLGGLSGWSSISCPLSNG